MKNKSNSAFFFVLLHFNSKDFPMEKKSILIDLSILRHPMCGLGQIGLNYGRWYQQHARELSDRLDITLLVPKNYIGAFGNDVHYLRRNDLHRQFPWTMPYFDIWHAINQGSAFRPKSRRTRFILTIHDVNFLYEKTPEKQRKYKRKLQRQCDRATEFTFISNFARQDTERFISLHDKPVRVIYNGVEDLTVGAQESPLAALQLPPETPFFLSLGEVKQKKQIHTLFPLMDRFPDYHLIVAGNDKTKYADSLRPQLPQHPNIHIIGIVSDAQRRWLYAHCTALLFPSIAEGFGLPVIEAMQWGKPVFCSNYTSLPEIGSTHAHYFTDFEPNHMAAVISEGLGNYDDEKAAKEKTYAATFSYEKHMRQYIDLFLDEVR